MAAKKKSTQEIKKDKKVNQNLTAAKPGSGKHVEETQSDYVRRRMAQIQNSVFDEIEARRAATASVSPAESGRVRMGEPTDTEAARSVAPGTSATAPRSTTPPATGTSAAQTYPTPRSTAPTTGGSAAQSYPTPRLAATAPLEQIYDQIFQTVDANKSAMMEGMTAGEKFLAGQGKLLIPGFGGTQKLDFTDPEKPVYTSGHLAEGGILAPMPEIPSATEQRRTGDVLSAMQRRGIEPEFQQEDEQAAIDRAKAARAQLGITQYQQQGLADVYAKVFSDVNMDRDDPAEHRYFAPDSREYREQQQYLDTEEETTETAPAQAQGDVPGVIMQRAQEIEGQRDKPDIFEDPEGWQRWMLERHTETERESAGMNRRDALQEEEKKADTKFAEISRQAKLSRGGTNNRPTNLNGKSEQIERERALLQSGDTSRGIAYNWRMGLSIAENGDQEAIQRRLDRAEESIRTELLEATQLEYDRWKMADEEYQRVLRMMAGGGDTITDRDGNVLTGDEAKAYVQGVYDMVTEAAEKYDQAMEKARETLSVEGKIRDAQEQYDRALIDMIGMNYDPAEVRGAAGEDGTGLIEAIRQAAQQNGMDPDEMLRMVLGEAHPGEDDVPEIPYTSMKEAYADAAKSAFSREGIKDLWDNLTGQSHTIRDTVSAAGEAYEYSMDEDAQLRDAMTARQQREMEYIRQTMGDEAADRYFEIMRSTLRRQRAEQEQKYYYAYGKDMPISATALSVIERGIGGTISAPSIAYAYATGKEIDLYGPQYAGMDRSNAMREGAKETAVESLSPRIQGLGLSKEAADSAISFIYDTGVSVLGDSMFNMAIGMATGIPMVGETMLGMSAFTDTTMEALRSGATEDQAVYMGLVAGAAEIITEHMHFDNFLDMFGKGKSSVLIDFLKNMGEETLEEGTSEIVNIITEWAVMQDRSTWELRYKELQDSGMTPEQAEKTVIGEILKQIGLAGLGGALGGAMGSGAGFVAGTIAQSGAMTPSVLRDYARELPDEVAGYFLEGLEQHRGEEADYVRAFDALYRYGRLGTDFDTVTQKLPDTIKLLGEDAAREFWHAGEVVRGESGKGDRYEKRNIADDSAMLERFARAAFEMARAEYEETGKVTMQDGTVLSGTEASDKVEELSQAWLQAQEKAENDQAVVPEVEKAAELRAHQDAMNKLEEQKQGKADTQTTPKQAQQEAEPAQGQQTESTAQSTQAHSLHPAQQGTEATQGEWQTQADTQQSTQAHSLHPAQQSAEAEAGQWQTQGDTQQKSTLEQIAEQSVAMQEQEQKQAPASVAEAAEQAVQSQQTQTQETQAQQKTKARPTIHEYQTETQAKTAEKLIKMARENMPELATVAETYNGPEIAPFISNYVSDAQVRSIETYKRAFDAIFDLGRLNMDRGNMTELTEKFVAASGMQDSTRDAIFTAGRNAALADMTPGVKKLYTKKLTNEEAQMVTVLDQIGRAYGLQIVITNTTGGGASGYYSGGRRIVVALDAKDGAIAQTGIHEMVHYLRRNYREGYNVLHDTVMKHLEQASGGDFDLDKTRVQRSKQYENQTKNMSLDEMIDYLDEEIVAEATTAFLGDEKAVRDFVKNNYNLAQKIQHFLHDFVEKVKSIVAEYVKHTGHDEVAAMLSRGTEALQEVADQFDRAMRVAAGQETTEGGELRTSGKASMTQASLNLTEREQQALEAVGAQMSKRGDVAYISPVDLKLSLTSLKKSEYWTAREEAAEALSKKLGVSKEAALHYIDNLTSIAAIVESNRDLYDYDAEGSYTALKKNQEYKYTIDFSTLCAKRLIYTGTFDAIQHALKDVVLTEDDFVKLRTLMEERGDTVPCAFCYVESRRKDAGKYIQQFIDKYTAAQAGDGKMWLGPKNTARYKAFDVEAGFTPSIADFNTTDGVTNMIANHPDVWAAYSHFITALGVGKPRLVENMTDYRSEILERFKRPGSVAAMNRRGGLRLQSYSDFQLLNLLDMMQVATDMARVGLKSQAYTKVAAFARIFGDANIKINLSLVAKGVDAKGNLIFDDKEGIDHKEAFAIRDAHSYNVGTVVVTKDDATTIAALKDPRIDFVLPFHRSGWSQHNLELLGIGDFQDYTNYQSERSKVTGKTISTQLYPSMYWDYSLTGDENAQRYLAECEKRGRVPKFPQFKDIPGYWKLLIDFKMYDNEGKGAPQLAVRPDFDMDEATKALREYDGGEKKLPVDQKVADEMIEHLRQTHPEANEGGIRLNLTTSLEERVTGDDLLAAQDLIEEVRDNGGEVDENGYITLYHRTTEQNAARIRATGRMFAKEDGLFFSTKRDGQNEGYGDSVVTFKIPAEKLVLDDVFGDEAHLRYPLGRARSADMSEYVLQENTQIPEHPRFNKTSPVEQVGDMIAVHNQWDVRAVLADGGFYMPSIAATKAEMGHTDFGPNSFLFRGETIDPERSVYNKVMGADASTAVEAAVATGSRKTAQGARIAEQTIQRLIARVPAFFQSDVRAYFEEQFADTPARNKEEALHDSAVWSEYGREPLDDYYGKAAFLSDQGAELPVRHHEFEDGYLDESGESGYDTIEEEDIEKAMAEHGYTNHDFYQWLADLRKGIEYEQTVRTLDGEQRMSRASKLQAMREMGRYDGRDAGEGGSAYIAGIKSYKTLDEMRADRDKLNPDRDAYHQGQEAAVQAAEKLADEINNRLRAAGDQEHYITSEWLFDAIYAINETRKPQLAAKTVKDQYGITLTRGELIRLRKIVGMVQNAPRRYFEAKPHRFVGLNEVALAVLPESTDKDLIRRLYEAGVQDIALYPDGDDEARLAIMNSPRAPRFLMTSETEQVGDMVAQHNLNENNALMVLRMGGIPMGSFAITKASIGFPHFGPISFVVGKDSIDPANPLNRVMGNDAYTPRVGQAKSKFEDPRWKALSQFINTLHEDLKTSIQMWVESVMIPAANEGANEIPYDTAYWSDGMLGMYLSSQAKDHEPVYRRTDLDGNFDAEMTEIYDEFLNRIESEGALKQFKSDAELMWGDELRDKYSRYMPETETEDEVAFMRQALSYLLLDRGKKARIENVYNYSATLAKFQSEADEGEFVNWLKKALGEKPFIPYYVGIPQTLQGMVDAMRSVGDKGINAYGMDAIKAKGAKEYKTLDAIRADKGRLMRIREDKYQQMIRRIQRNYDDLADKLRKVGKITYSDEYQSMMEDAAYAYSMAETEQSVRDAFSKKGIVLTSDESQNVIKVLEQFRNMPVDYFEAKPQRVIGLNEILYAIVPDNSSQELLDALKEAGIETRVYRAGDEDDRTRVLNQLPTTIRFSLGTESDGGDAMDRDGALNIPIDVKIDAQEVQDYARAALANGRKIANQTVDALTNNKIDAAAGKILKAVQSKYGREALRMKMIQLAQEYAKNGPSDGTMAETVKLAQDILEQSTKKDDSLSKEYADVKKRLRETPIVLTSTQMTEVAYHWGSVAEFKRQMRGSLKIVKSDGVSLDSLWLELSERAPEFFPTTTGEAEMPEALADFREAIKPRIDNIYGMDRDALAADLALRIQGDLMVVLGARAQAKNMYGSLQEMRTAWDEEMKKRVQEDNKKRVEEFSKLATDLRAAKERGDRGAYDSRMRKYRELVKREGMSRMISEATFNRRMLERNAEKTAKARERLTKKANSLLTRLRKPYKGEHIPTMLQQTVLDVLNALDFAGEGAPTVKEKDFASKLEAITGFYDKVLAAQSRGETAQEAEGTLITVCQKQVDDLKRYLGGILESGKIRIDDMDFHGLGYLNAAMDMINQTIDTINTLWRGDRYKKVSDLAEATMDDLDKMKEQTFSRGSLRGMAYDLLQRQMATPETYGQLLGEAGKSLIDSLFEGERIMEKRIQEASDHTREAMEKAGVTDAEIGEWQRHVQTLHFKGGTVKMTDSMVMSLYLTMLRPQGLQHILGNGIRIPSTKETGNQVKTIFMAGTDTRTVYAALTDKQRTVANALQKYLANDVAKWGNDITQAMYLYDAFTEKSYWPLTSDPNVLKTQEPTADRNLGALMNPGFLKPLVEGANNPVIIQDAFQVYNKHISEMANYNGLAMPISNTLAMLNYVRKDEVEENVYRITGTVKQSMERALGKSGATYLTNLVQDLNAARHEQEKTPIDKLLGNYKKYAVVGKIRVMIQQPTSIVRAASEIDYRYLMAGMHAPKGTMEEMVQHSALAWWKQNGNYETGMGKSMMQMMFGDTSERVPGTKWGRDTVMEKVTTFGGAIDPGKADDFAWQRMWQAVKLETRDKHPELKQGSDAYWEHVTKRFEKIMDRTQVVDTVMHRSAIMRSTNAINKTVTSFMAEPIASYNMLMRDVVELYRNWNTPEKRDKLAKLCNDAIVYTAAAFVTAIATGLVDAMRNPSDDDKDLLERLKGDFWKDWIFYWLKNGIGEWRVWRNLPYLQEGMDILVGDEMPEALASWITGRDEFRISIKPGSYELPQMQGISNLVAQTKKVMDYIAGGNTKRSTFYGGIIRPMSTGLGELFGLPAGVLNTLETFDRFLGFNLTKTSVGYTSTTETYDALYQAIASGDKKKADRIRQELREGKYGMTEKTTKTIQTGIGKVLAKEDSRIAEAHELLQRGQYIAAQGIIEEIIGEGFDKDVVEYAVNYYKTIMASEAKDRYIAAIGAQDDEQASQIMEDAIAAGYVTRSAAEKWMPTTGEDETLEASMMSRETFVRAMESGTQADISAALQAAREAGTKDTTIAGWLNDRYKDEYIALWRSGRKAEANALGRRLQALGLMKELKSGTVNCFRDDYLKGWQKEAEKG